MATLQHALTRGLDIVFQLEESEVLSEPLPTREKRRAILSLEATEGGAGVLSRLISDPDSVARVARAALDLMHYENVDAAIRSGSPDDLVVAAEVNCVRGCYKCLLSYFNQPDHNLIDRTDPEVLAVLLRLARSTVRPVPRTAPATSVWGEALLRWKLPAPDAAPLVVNGTELAPCWRSLRVVGVLGEAAPELRDALEAKGYAVVDLPPEPGEEPPVELRALLRGTA